MRLTGLPGRLSALPSRVQALPKRAEAFYTSEAWRSYRKRHREWTSARQGGVWCCKCGSKHRLILDHRVERRDGGADLPPFEEADWYCSGCHNRKTAEARRQRVGGGQKSGG